MERDYFEEYERIMKKDKERNKDFNMKVFDEMKQIKYYFEYLRTNEKLFELERKRLEA